MKIIILLLMIVYLVPSIHSWGNCPRYHYKKHQQRSRFLTKLPNSRQLNSIALVGTVNSLSIIQNGTWQLGQTQELSLADQMKFGVRVIEINVGASSSSNELFLFSRSEYLNSTFDQVLEEMENFLTDNPREFLILYIHQQKNYYGSATRSCEVINWYKSLIAGIRLTSDWKLNNTIGEVRGRILLATRSETLNECAVNLYNNCKIQETRVSNYISFSPQQAKWYAVQKLQTESFSLQRMCFVNYVVDHDDVFAPLYSKGSYSNRDNICEEPLNYRMAQNFRNPRRALIIVMAADVTQELIDRVISSNFVGNNH